MEKIEVRIEEKWLKDIEKFKGKIELWRYKIEVDVMVMEILMVNIWMKEGRRGIGDIMKGIVIKIIEWIEEEKDLEKYMEKLEN